MTTIKAMCPIPFLEGVRRPGSGATPLPSILQARAAAGARTIACVRAPPPDPAQATPPGLWQGRSVLYTALALLGVLWLQLMPALFAGLGGFVLYRWIRRHVQAYTASWKSQPLTAFFFLVVIALIAFAVFTAFEFLLGASSGGLVKLLRLAADTLDQIRDTAPQWLASRLPESAAAMQEAISGWLRSHAGEMQQWGRHALHILVNLIVGLVIGLIAAASTRPPQPPTLAIRLVLDRLQQLAQAFADVFAAQLRVSAINTVLTGIYLLVVLPAFGERVPLSHTLVAFTFLASLLPIVGNLLSNAAITIAALTVSPLLGAVSLGFLVVIHKLEYFLNARIVGGRIRVPTYGMLATMLVLEAAFGVAGLVAAPIYAAWMTRELREGKWI
jgi:predicted PurR-regulated permease PerM